MRQTKELSDTVINFLKESNIRFVSINDIYNITNMQPSEKFKIDKVISILKFYKVIEFDTEFLLYRNNYYKDIEEANK